MSTLRELDGLYEDHCHTRQKQTAAGVAFPGINAKTLTPVEKRVSPDPLLETHCHRAGQENASVRAGAPLTPTAGPFSVAPSRALEENKRVRDPCPKE